MFDNMRPITESYEFIIEFNGIDRHVFITHHIDKDNPHASDTDIYYLGEANEKKYFTQDEELIFKEFMYFIGFDRV